MKDNVKLIFCPKIFSLIQSLEIESVVTLTLSV